MSDAIRLTLRNPLTADDQPAEGVLAPMEGLDETTELKLLGLPEMKQGGRNSAIPLDTAATPAVSDMLERIEQALEGAARSGSAWRVRLDHLSESERDTLYDALGRGEVSAIIAGGTPEEGEAQVIESVFPGVWMGQASSQDGQDTTHWIEVGDCPRAVREVALSRPRNDIAMEALTAPRGAMNVMAVLAELRERSLAWKPGDENHVMNFTLFPMTPADSAFLSNVLGECGVRLTSGGYGAARVFMTGLRHVWAVQYLNGLGAVILDTLEVGDVPSAALASVEDFEDSAERLKQMREAYQV